VDIGGERVGKLRLERGKEPGSDIIQTSFILHPY
jgi:hypothetical protein